MSLESLLFWVPAVVTVVFALGVVLNLRNAVYAALCLVVVMLGLACLFVALHAEFIGLIQVIVYAGAIVVLFLFVIMLMNLRGGALGADRQPGLKIVGIGLVAAGTAKLAALLAAASRPWAEVDSAFGTTREIGLSLYTDFLLPFEVAGILLLAGIVGAVILSKKTLE